MRRLAARCLAITLLLSTAACKPREKIHLEPTDESAASLMTTVNAADPAAALQLIRGFHQIEQNSWRWTMGQFSVVLKPPPNASQNGARLVVRFSLPDAVLQNTGKITLRASIAGTPVGEAAYATAGEYTFSTDLPGRVIPQNAVTVDFALDKYLQAGTVDARELGIIVSSIALEGR